MLLTLAAVWGASYLFIKVAVDEIEPAPMMAFRTLVAAVVQASVPIFNALLVLRFLPHERLTRTQALGLAIGILGVAVVTGVHPEGGTLAILGALAVVLSSLSYASAGVYGQRAVSGTAGPVLAAGSMLVGTLILTPIALFQLPADVPSLEATASVL